MKREEISKELLHQFTRRLVDQGLLIEAGWVGYKHMCLKDRTPTLDEIHSAFLAGAAYLFSSIMGVLDEGSEPTANDLLTLDSISHELAEFIRLVKENTSH